MQYWQFSVGLNQGRKSLGGGAWLGTGDGGHDTLINPLDSRGNYSATSNDTKLVHWPLMGCYILYSEEGPGRAAAPSSLLLAYQM